MARIVVPPIKGKMPPPPTPQIVRDFKSQTAALKEMPLAGIECRANGHFWQPAQGEKIQKGWWVEQRCANCKSTRQQWLDKYGLLIRAAITYSVDFELLRGLGHNSGVRKGAARLEAMHRNKMPAVDEVQPAKVTREAPKPPLFES